MLTATSSSTPDLTEYRNRQRMYPVTTNRELDEIEVRRFGTSGHITGVSQDLSTEDIDRCLL